MSTRKHAIDERTHERTEKTFPCFVRGQMFQKRCFDKSATKQFPAKVCTAIIAYDETDGEAKPKETMDDIIHNITHLEDNETKRYDCPGELTHLVLDIALLKAQDAKYKQHHVEAKGNPRMVELQVVT
jgi:hypothetical protein